MASPQPPEFFVDRSLGRRRLPELLRAAGWLIQVHHDVYGARDEEVPDVEWLEYCGRTELSALTADRQLRYRPHELAVIERCGIRVFTLPGNLAAAEAGARLIRNGDSLVAAHAEAGPAIYSIQPDRIVRVFP